MFNLFKKKSPVEALDRQYKKLMKEAFDLAKINRAESDKKYKEAEEIAQEIEKLQGQGQ